MEGVGTVAGGRDLVVGSGLCSVGRTVWVECVGSGQGVECEGSDGSVGSVECVGIVLVSTLLPVCTLGVGNTTAGGTATIGGREDD